MPTIVKRNWARVIVAIVILIICTLNRPVYSAEFKPGQVAIVVVDKAEFKEGDKVVGKAAIGQAVEVGQYNKGWIWVLSSKGWIQEKNLLDLDTVVKQKTEQSKRNLLLKIIIYVELLIII